MDQPLKLLEQLLQEIKDGKIAIVMSTFEPERKSGLQEFRFTVRKVRGNGHPSAA
jgi:hypothetical protein